MPVKTKAFTAATLRSSQTQRPDYRDDSSERGTRNTKVSTRRTRCNAAMQVREPDGQRAHRGLLRPVQGRVSESPLVPEPCGCNEKVGGVVRTKMKTDLMEPSATRCLRTSYNRNTRPACVSHLVRKSLTRIERILGRGPQSTKRLRAQQEETRASSHLCIAKLDAYSLLNQIFHYSYTYTDNNTITFKLNTIKVSKINKQ